MIETANIGVTLGRGGPRHGPELVFGTRDPADSTAPALQEAPRAAAREVARGRDRGTELESRVEQR